MVYNFTKCECLRIQELCQSSKEIVFEVEQIFFPDYRLCSFTKYLQFTLGKFELKSKVTAFEFCSIVMCKNWKTFGAKRRTIMFQTVKNSNMLILVMFISDVKAIISFKNFTSKAIVHTFMPRKQDDSFRIWMKY